MTRGIADSSIRSNRALIRCDLDRLGAGEFDFVGTRDDRSAAFGLNSDRPWEAVVGAGVCGRMMFYSVDFPRRIDCDRHIIELVLSVRCT